MYSINSMDSQSFHICRMQCNWIQSLKRHSILISESGEMQRIDFYKNNKLLSIVCKECHLPRITNIVTFYPDSAYNAKIHLDGACFYICNSRLHSLHNKLSVSWIIVCFRNEYNSQPHSISRYLQYKN